MNTTISNLYQCGINGKVKSIETKEYYISQKSGEIKKGKLKEYSLVVYNEDGYMLSHNFRTSKFDMKILYEYDSNRNILKESVYEKEVLDYEMIYKYDLNGNLIESLINSPNDTYCIGTNYEYDSKGNLIKEHMKNTEDFDREEIHKYDSEGKKIEFYSYSNGEPNSKNIYKYDLKGNTIEIDYYDSKEELIGKHKYEYDSNGNKTEFVYLPDETLIKKNILNANRKIIEMYLCNSEGNLYLKLKYNYNSLDNLMEKCSHDSNGNILYKETHEYELDQNNNWTKDIVLKNKRGSIIIIRKIDYYGKTQNE
ncbi:MAG: hypothetical protein H6Q16_210 [Bacteroidetes bacterium]|nr:hypothetical protein [Bacteroidota bacterium]